MVGLTETPAATDFDDFPFSENGHQENLGSIFLQKDVYSSADLEELLDIQQRIGASHHVQRPYYRYAMERDQTRIKPFIDEEICALQTPNGSAVLKIKTGTIESFRRDQLAAVIHDQTAEYVKQKTMGEFPAGDQVEEEALTAIMIDGSSYSDIYVVIYLDYQNGGYKPLSGAKLVKGQSVRTIWELNANPDFASSLPTMAALSINQDKLELSPELELMQEQEVWCASRLYGTSVEGVDTTLPPLPFIVSAYCPQAVQAYYQEFGGVQPMGLIYDTHLKRLTSFLKRFFGSRLVAEDGEVQAKPEVLNTVLHYHYEGLSDELRVAYFLMEEFLIKSRSYLEKNNLPQIEME